MALVLTDWCARAAYLSSTPLRPVPDEEASRALQAAVALKDEVEPFAAWVGEAGWEALFRGVVASERGLPSDRPLPVTCLVGSKDASRRRPFVSCRSWSRPLPPASLLRLDGGSGSAERGVYAVSPPFHWLLRSRDLDLARTLLLGCELCGTFSFGPGPLRERETPLATPADLARLVDSVPAPARDTGRARTAASWVLASCASPREAACALYACLPVRRGGFGLPTPLCNHEVVLGPEARSLLPGRARIRLDLAWPAQSVAVEYDSHWHDGASRQLADKDREVAASLEGFRVVPLTPRVAASQRRLDVFMGQLASLLGVRTRPLSPSTLETRSRLYRGLFTPWELW